MRGRCWRYFPVIVAAWGNAISADWIVFTSSVVTVIGPTPPGMGVILEARRETLSKSQSPTSRRQGSRFIPTSMTKAPVLTIGPTIKLGQPAAATRMSSRMVNCARSRACMADRCRGVALHEHECHRLADDVAGTDNDGIPTGHFDSCMIEEPHDTIGRAGRKDRLTDDEAADVVEMKAVDIFLARYGAHDHLDVELGRQLHEDAMDRVDHFLALQCAPRTRSGLRRPGRDPFEMLC
jgi:hypothetical protein